MIQQMTKSAFYHPTTEGNKPNESQTNGQHKMGNTVGISQMSRLQVKTISFQVTIHFLNPHPDAVMTNQKTGIGLIANQKPGFFFTFVPVNNQEEPTGIMLLSQSDPTNRLCLSLRNWQPIKLDPILIGTANQVATILVDNKRPTLAAQPTQEMNRFKTSITHDPHLTILWH